MAEGVVIERGTLPNGVEYRIWRCHRTGKCIGYIGGGEGKRRNVRWLRQVLAGKREIKARTGTK